MKLIGITGGVGAGKTQVLSYLASHCSCRILLADDVANEVKLPGQECYGQLVELLGEGVLDAEGRIDKGKMAAPNFCGQGTARQSERDHPSCGESIHITGSG